jgi:hypothetical protein
LTLAGLVRGGLGEDQRPGAPFISHTTVMYHITRNGVQQGQYTLEQIKSMLASGSLNGNDLAWQDGMAEWQPLSSLPGVGSFGGPPPLHGGPIAPQVGAYAPPQSNLGGQGGYPGPASSSGMAVASLVLGILCLILFFTHVIALIIGLLAVIFGHVSRGAIRRSAGRLSGSGMALAGLITGYTGMLLAVIILVTAAFFFTKIIDEASKDPNLRKSLEEMQKEMEKKRNENP